MIPMTLPEIAAVVDGTVHDDDAVTVTAPAFVDSRAAEVGGLFVAFAGEHVDGHDYASAAVEGGAVAVLGARPTGVPTVVVDDPQAALGRLARHPPGRPPQARGGASTRAGWSPSRDPRARPAPRTCSPRCSPRRARRWRPGAPSTTRSGCR